MFTLKFPTSSLYYISHTLFALFLFLAISGCQSPSQRPNVTHPEIKLAQESGFKTSIIKTQDFEITGLIKNNDTNMNKKINKKLVIYIEGDGRSWIKKHILSKNPTPPYALGLRLAIQDPRSADPDSTVAYLARPCQFTQHNPTPTTCDAKYWSSDRFSEVVIQNMNQAVDNLKNQLELSKQNKIELIGYSGGAAVAVLLAARRNDVEIIRTVAGDLNHALMSEYHHTTALSHSLNPIDYAQKINKIKQVHYIGTQDKIVPQYVTQNFIDKSRLEQINQDPGIKLVSVEATHQRGWESKWSVLISNVP
jgi:hypothetical protein